MTETAEKPYYRWTVMSIIMLGSFMAVLDSSIVNVALPNMMSTFGVNREQIEWVTTAFMLTTAVIMPLVGWMVGRLGHKILYLSALLIFTVGSALCGFAWSYDSLVLARVLQAIGGGAIQPVGMTIVADLFAPHERGKALGIWATGIMFGPALGPTLGGYLTDWFSWRSIFYVNLPFGALALIAGLAIMKTDHLAGRPRVPFDAWGFSFLALALIGGLLGLSQGQDKGWNSDYIYTCFACSLAGLIMFLGVETSAPHPLLPLGLFRARNFSIAMVLAVFRALALFGGVFLLPIFLENLVGYTTIQTGLRMMPGAIAVGIMMPIAGRLADRYPPRGLAAFGCAVAGSSLLLYGRLDPLSSLTMIIGPQIIRGIGLAFMMSPLLTAAINSVPKEQVATASSFLNVGQQVGGAFGIAFLNTFVTDAIHQHAVRLGEHFPTGSHPFSYFAWQVSGLTIRHLQGISLPGQAKALAVAGQIIAQKASVLGFENGFMIAGLVLLCGVPLALFLKGAAHHQAFAAGRRPEAPEAEAVG